MENEYTPPKFRTVHPPEDHRRTEPDRLHIPDEHRKWVLTNVNMELLTAIRRIKNT